MYSWLRRHGWLLTVLAIASFTMLWRLDAQPYQNWDESIHGEVSWEMVERGDWLTLSYTNGPYFRKPPLKIWASATLFRAFGVTPWTLRLPSAIAGIGTALLTAWWMWEWRRRRLDAFLAGFIVATMQPIAHHAFRTGEMDGMLAFFTTLTLYAWWRHTTPPRRPEESATKDLTRTSDEPITDRKRMRWTLLLGLSLGLAVMTKSAAGLIPIPIIALHWLIHRRTIHLPFRVLLCSVLSFSVVVLPWHLAMIFIHGTAFWRDYIGWHVVERVTTALHNTSAPWWFYFPTFTKRFLPYTYGFVPAIAYALAGRRAREQKTESQTMDVLLIWIATVFVGFTFAATKFDWYLLPLYPAAAMLTAAFIGRAYRVLAGHHSPLRIALAALTVTIVLASGVRTIARHLRASYAPHPFTAVVAELRGNVNGIVAYGFSWQHEPAAYFLLRTALPEVRVTDGLSDTKRTLAGLASREHSALVTKTTMTLPDTFRGTLVDPKTFGQFTVWTFALGDPPPDARGGDEDSSRRSIDSVQTR